MIKKILWLILPFLLGISPLLSQSGGFFMTYGGEQSDKVFEVTLASNGEYAFVGRTSSFGEGNTNIWLVKTDSNGQLLWQRTFGGDYIDAGLAIEETLDGGFLIGGTLGEQDFFGGNIADAYLIKTNSSGDSIWTKTGSALGVSSGLVTSILQ